MRLSLSVLILGLLFAITACSANVPTPTVASFKITRTSPARATETASRAAESAAATLTSVPAFSDAPTASSTVTPQLGSTAADLALSAILQRCWQVKDPSELSGSIKLQRDGFDCARSSLLDLARSNPTYAPVHRLLAWGYYYKDNSISQAVAEYRTAANLYRQDENRAGESDIRLRLGLILVGTNEGQGCNELLLAESLAPENAQAGQYANAYNCGRSIAAALPPIVVSVTPSVVTATATITAPIQTKSKIMFRSNRGPEGYYMMNAEGGGVQPVSAAAYDEAARYEAFSPDRQQIAVVRLVGSTNKYGLNNEIVITDLKGDNGRALPNPANDYDPAWSTVPLFDGQTWLAFVSNRGDPAHPTIQGEELWIEHSDGSDVRRLTCHGPNYSKHPSWSPDGRRLVLFSDAPNGGNNQIYVIDLAGLGTATDPCDVGGTWKNISNNSYDEKDPIWVK
ncbi:MAG: hypothetical protein ACM3JD_02055 [Rudaea sp.]